MRITKLEPQKANAKRYNVFVDEKFLMGINESVLVRFRLKSGMEVDGVFLEELKKTEGISKAKHKALDYLSYADHSKERLQQKLKKAGFDELEIGPTLDALEQSGLLNDEQYARKLCRYCYDKKLYGKNRALMELKNKGIERSLANEVAGQECPDDFLEKICILLQKKYKAIKEPTQAELEKMIPIFNAIRS